MINLDSVLSEFSPSPSQSRTFYAAIDWWIHGHYGIFEISGPPGAGKSLLINMIVKAFGIPMERVACMAYTGSAAINMRLKGMQNARTIFSWLYDFKEVPILDQYGKPLLDPVFHTPRYKMEFVPKGSLPGIELLIIDEGGMVPENMLPVLLHLGIPIIVAGDLDQLPPVAGKPAFLTNPDTVHKLTEIMRQEENNTIIQFSQMLLHGIPIPYGKHGNVLVMYDDEVTDDIISKSDILICGKNATRDALNNHVRHDMFGFKSKTPNLGERIVCRKNNWNIEAGGINLTNGLLGSCVSIPDPSSFNIDDRTFKIWFKPDSIPEIFQDVDVDYDYITCTDKKRRDELLSNFHKKGNKFEFGYAITTHMSQGSEYSKGIYFEEYMNADINRNLHYVGITRFRDRCIYVKHRPKNYYYK